jgi:hypothetical protein
MTGVKHTGTLTLKRALKVLSARLKRVGAPFFAFRSSTACPGRGSRRFEAKPI